MTLAAWKFSIAGTHVAVTIADSEQDARTRMIAYGERWREEDPAMDPAWLESAAVERIPIDRPVVLSWTALIPITRS